MVYLLMWNIKGDILKNVGNQTVLVTCMDISQNIFCFPTEEKVKLGWNIVKVSK